MIKRRTLVLALVLSVLFAPLAADAQPAGKISRVGILTVARTGDVEVQKNFDALREGLRERGWLDGQNIAFEYRWADGKYERLPDLAAELVRLKVDVIVGATTPLIKAVKNATETIPIVMVAIIDPVAAGFVHSLARPGGNITGLSPISGPEIIGKQLGLLKEIMPAGPRVAVLMNPANPAHEPLVREAEAAGRALQVRTQLFAARSANDLESAFSAMTQERAGAVLVVLDALFFTLRGRIAELATANRLPAMYGSRVHVDDGGLIAYGASVLEQWRRAAIHVDKILRGAKPGDLPVEQPTKFELVINMRTAKALGLTIPPSLLLRADQVIE